jgi:hypothetical protein
MGPFCLTHPQQKQPASSPSDYRQVANLLSLTSKLKLHNRWRKMDGAKFAPPRAVFHATLT